MTVAIDTSGIGSEVEFRHFHLFCGLGGGAKGWNRGTARVGDLVGRWRCIGGIDSDPAAIRDFTRAAGVPGTVLDLFSEEQYRAFHGESPPAGWREAIANDIRKAAHGERPHAVFLSAPCKGFSGLLPEKSSATAKYQALNELTLRGIWLMLEAWGDDPPELIVFENVPRIQKRGRRLLDQISALLRNHGYAVAETTHDCGELGNLGQSRKRFLLVARHEVKVPPFLYQPDRQRLRGVGEILEKLPLPGDPAGGPMHRMPALQWKTWVRLAFVEAGADWRSLNRLAVENGVLRDYGILPETDWQASVLGVRRWDEPTGTVAGRSTPTNGSYSVADPRPENASDRPNFAVGGWDDPAATITSQRSPGQGRFSVADPRIDGHEKSVQLGVRPWDKPSGVVTGQMVAGGGPNSVADPRLEGKPRFNNTFRIVPWSNSSPAVAGPGGPAGGLSVADPRAGSGRHVNGKYRVTAFDEPANAVIGASTTGNGAFVVADPRTGYGPNSHRNKLKVIGYEDTAGTVTGSDRVGSGALSVADPRPGNQLRNGAHGVRPWDETSGTIAGESLPSNGAFAVADPRSGLAEDRAHYQTGGHYGVVPWDQNSRAVPAFSKHDGGPWSVADPRGAEGEPLIELPKPKDRLVAVIWALDGTWHRPFTTLELAALQSLVDPDEMFVLEGNSDSAWRERIGNAVPPDAAEAMSGMFAQTLLLAMTGETFMLSSQPIWVRPVATALAVDQRGNIPEEDKAS